MLSFFCAHLTNDKAIGAFPRKQYRNFERATLLVFDYMKIV